MSKVFRVFISETSQFHHDIEADSAYDAKEQVRANLDSVEASERIEPVEDQDGYSGYQVDDAIEISGEESDLARRERTTRLC